MLTANDMRMYLKFVFILLFVTTITRSVAQNLEGIGQGDAFGISGGINANAVFYDASGMDGRRDPFNYFLSGNLNLSVYGWAVPLSFSYSNQNASFQQPFNQYGLSPTYKWITAHAGYRSMTFSNYTMNGHMFLGGGLDLAPSDRFKISGFYGRLQNAVEEDTLINNMPAYRRMGGGMKATFGDSKHFVDLIIFKAQDEINSLRAAPVKSDIKPEENLVLGVNFGVTLGRRMSVKGEFGSSAISKDVRSEEVSSGNVHGKIPFGFTPRASSSYYEAFKASMQYAFTDAGIGVAYERVDPGYRTLGAYYFNNNLENISLTATSAMVNKKVRVNAQVGIQRNNLDNQELNTMRRVAGSVNTNIQASSKLMLALNYSNFQTIINFRSQFVDLNQVSPYDNLDTLNYRQISENANVNANYVLNESKAFRQNINMNISFQKTSDIQASIEQPTGASFYNLNSNYTLVLGEKNLTFNLAGNANFTQSVSMKNRIFGPSASVRKTFFQKKLSTNMTLSYNAAYANNVRTSAVMNLRGGAGYTLMDKHQFDFTVTRVSRQSSQGENTISFNELTVQFGYSYNFSL